MNPIVNPKNLDLFPEANTVEYNSIRNAVRFYSTQVFAMGPNVSRLYFKEYFILYWSGDWIIESSNEGKLNRNGKQYQIVYKSPLTRGKILAKLDDQFILSFREPLDGFQLNPVVIISGGKRNV